MSGASVRGEHLRRSYGQGADAVAALDDVSFVVPAGATAAIVGPSGSGKSTLTTVLAGLQRPDAGRALIGEHDLTALSEAQLLAVRAGPLAVVAQNPTRNLLPYASAADNIRFAQRGARARRRAGLPDATDLLRSLGLGAVAEVRADRLSGGERQRLALAAGFSSRPDVLLADEPSSQLDEANRDLVVDLLLRMNAESGVTVVAVTHDPQVSARLGQVLTLSAGRLATGGTS